MKIKIILAVLGILWACSCGTVNAKTDSCADVKVLMYHHVEDIKLAKENNRVGLDVTPDMFEQQMKYLQNKGYSVIGPDQLIDFLDIGTKLPKKSIMITFDDAYEDNYLNAFPILKKYGFMATIFTPTGLIENPEYLKWNQIDEMKNSGLIYLANHTWSHYKANGTKQKEEQEIGTANTQLNDKGLNVLKIFAYPYGSSSKIAKEVLQSLGYKAAFTTKYGTRACSNNRFDIPRVRIGNAPLNRYGL